jgi:hypothetical protein
MEFTNDQLLLLAIALAIAYYLYTSPQPVKQKESFGTWADLQRVARAQCERFQCGNQKNCGKKECRSCNTCGGPF